MPDKKKQLAAILGKRIRELRNAKGLTMEELAFRAGIEYAQLSRVELGKINTSVYQLHLLSNALEVSIEEIVKGIKT